MFVCLSVFLCVCVRVCFLTLRTLCEGLGLEEALCEAALEGVLVSVRNVPALQQRLQGLHLRTTVPPEQTLQGGAPSGGRGQRQGTGDTVRGQGPGS